ncbi:heme o synthase [Emcibacter sp.]|uniref:heme o synthase n=1 Tax=Emcibacter sp. TaxID=1979954 RepID=UPI002AA928C9|nr:heme o synthase [Emcibacter sp.]
MYASSVEQENYDYYEPAARDFFDLLKPRVMSLVIFTGLVGLLLAPGHIHPVEAFTAILCIAVAAGASGCLNMWYDADIDAVMDRTRNRPIPAGRIAPETALHFGVALSVASVLMMGLAVNVAAAVLLAITIGFYIFIYTMWLKRRTPQNIVIGGAAGAFPPMIGWVAVTGNVSIESLVLFGIIFMWTPPHFWALSLFACKDYEKVGVPMLPVVSGEAETRKQILIYSLLMVPVTLAPWVMGFAGLIYGVTAVALGGVFLALAASLFRTGEIKTAKQLFFYSILYLFVLFAVLGAEALLRMGDLI